jgi:hypothetical protein
MADPNRASNAAREQRLQRGLPLVPKRRPWLLVVVLVCSQARLHLSQTLATRPHNGGVQTSWLGGIEMLRLFF